MKNLVIVAASVTANNAAALSKVFVIFIVVVASGKARAVRTVGMN